MATVDTSKSAEPQARPAINPATEPSAETSLTNVSVTRAKPKAEKKAAQKARKITAEERHQLIAEAAYIRAEKRGFQGGDPVVDWLEAEQEVEQRLRKRPD